MDLEEEDAEMEKSKKASLQNALVYQETTLGLGSHSSDTKFWLVLSFVQLHHMKYRTLVAFY